MDSPIGKLVYAAGKKHVVGIDAETGQELWRTEIRRNTWSASSFCTIALRDEALYVVAGKFLNKLDAWTGDLLWSQEVLGGLGPMPMLVAGGDENAQAVMAAAVAQQQAQQAAAAGGGGAAFAGG